MPIQGWSSLGKCLSSIETILTLLQKAVLLYWLSKMEHRPYCATLRIFAVPSSFAEAIQNLCLARFSCLAVTCHVGNLRITSIWSFDSTVPTNPVAHFCLSYTVGKPFAACLLRRSVWLQAWDQRGHAALSEAAHAFWDADESWQQKYVMMLILLTIWSICNGNVKETWIDLRRRPKRPTPIHTHWLLFS